MSNTNNNAMNASNNGAPMLNNSNVPSAALLNQVANIAMLPSRGGGVVGDIMQQQHDPATTMAGNEMQQQQQHQQDGGVQQNQQPDPSKISKSMALLMESMKRSAMSRSIIKQFPSPFTKTQMSKGSSRSSTSSSNSNSKEAVVKAKRNSCRQSYTKSSASRNTKVQQPSS